jgi:hypothetical protein
VRWHGSQPIGYRLRSDHPERWVRFHRLPDPKRFADNDDGYREILDRHRTVAQRVRQIRDLVCESGVGLGATAVIVISTMGGSSWRDVLTAR